MEFYYERNAGQGAPTAGVAKIIFILIRDFPPRAISGYSLKISPAASSDNTAINLASATDTPNAYASSSALTFLRLSLI